DGEDGAAVLTCLHADRTAVTLDHLLDDGEAEARPAVAATGGEEGLEDPLAHAIGNAAPGVGDAEHHLSVPRPHGKHDAVAGHLPTLDRLRGVDEEIDEELAQLHRISPE